MRTTVLIPALALLAATMAEAQQRVTRGTSTAQSAVSVYNADGTMRVSGSLDVAAERVIESDVAVLNGPVVIAGQVTGSLVAINADVHLSRGARIGEHVIIVGGSLTREEEVTVGGEVRTQAELMRYSLVEQRLVPEEERWADWRPHWDGPGLGDRGESYTDFFFVGSSTYNRVEGLPVRVGPRFRRPTNWGRIQVEAFGIVRSAGPVKWERGTLGHDARADLRLGVRNGLVLGARAFDLIAPVESWQLSDAEAGLATALLHRDFRDYYGRHGWEASLGGRLGEEASLHVVGGSERWRGVVARDPFTLARSDDPWRLNPMMDDGKVDLASVRLRVDTRDRYRSPLLGGWYVNADLERGSGTIARVTGGTLGTPEELTYTRGFVDARRYNRLSPGTQLNLRMVAGGWLGGDALPSQRRLSLGGPGAIDGYDFRRNLHETDVFTCGGIDAEPGRPSLCQRVALVQIELRQSLEFDWYDWDSGRWWHPGGDVTPSWVLFADAGRGWTVPGVVSGASSGFDESGIPPFATFRTSVGLGIDFGSMGVYLAKSTSTSKEPVNVIVRLGRRF